MEESTEEKHYRVEQIDKTIWVVTALKGSALEWCAPIYRNQEGGNGNYAFGTTLAQGLAEIAQRHRITLIVPITAMSSLGGGNGAGTTQLIVITRPSYFHEASSPENEPPADPA